jgi:hypothetical protein
VTKMNWDRKSGGGGVEYLPSSAAWQLPSVGRVRKRKRKVRKASGPRVLKISCVCGHEGNVILPRAHGGVVLCCSQCGRKRKLATT